MKILIVDDTKFSRAMLLKRLPAHIKSGATIFQGENGQEALDLYKEHRPEIVFLDLTMPVMDGFDALDAIMAFDSGARVHVVTADIQKKSQERVMASGATSIEKKPIEEERLADIFSDFEKGLRQ